MHLFQERSSELCSAVALVARYICTKIVNPAGLAPLTASWLVALNKCPEVHPIGIGETCRRIMAKAILRILGPDIQEAAGSAQLCAGQEAGCEAVVHAMEKMFQEEHTEAVLQVDATKV